MFVTPAARGRKTCTHEPCRGARYNLIVRARAHIHTHRVRCTYCARATLAILREAGLTRTGFVSYLCDFTFLYRSNITRDCIFRNTRTSISRNTRRRCCIQCACTFVVTKNRTSTHRRSTASSLQRRLMSSTVGRRRRGQTRRPVSGSEKSHFLVELQ